MCSTLHLDVVADVTAVPPLATWGPTAYEITNQFAALAEVDFSNFDALIVIIGAHGVDGSIYSYT